jgi:hypothetical protein
MSMINFTSSDMPKAYAVKKPEESVAVSPVAKKAPAKKKAPVKKVQVSE